MTTTTIDTRLHQALTRLVGEAYERADAAGDDDHEPARYHALAVLYLATEYGIDAARVDRLLVIHERLSALAATEADEPLETDALREVRALRDAAERVVRE